MLIINADDWGRSKAATDAAASCFTSGRISSTSAMVFMADSERAAQIANEMNIDVGLHLNFSEAFSAPGVAREVDQAHSAIMRFLKFNKYALLLYHPFLRRQFALSLRAQVDEFTKLYGKAPSHLDGHQHMHLCSNILVDQLLPAGTKVRRSFSFAADEKGAINRAYRGWVDRRLARRHRTTDYFFALASNLPTERLRKIISFAREHVVELMTHPAVPAEFDRLMSEDFAEMIEKVSLGASAAI